MVLRVRVTDPLDGLRYTFKADSLHSFQRAKNLVSKEPETINWLRRNLRPGDVFLDIGANVGTFSIFAAKHLDEDGHVYACEPHLPTTVQLLQNVGANNLQDRVSVLSVAVSGDDAFAPFHYKRWRHGASGSQLDIADGPGLANPVGTEFKSGMRIDTMIDLGIIHAPNLVKIDTDGVELQITSGMKNLLTGAQRPRSLLVEIQVGEFQAQTAWMLQCGYALIDTHIGRKSKDLRDRGKSMDEIAFNALFEPAR